MRPMERRLIQLKTLRGLYRMKRFGVAYHSPAQPLAVSENLPADPARLSAMIRGCHLCELSKRRRHALCAAGAAGSGIMVVVDAPGAAEDQAGRWYEGRSGELLQKMIEGGLGLPVEAVYLTAALKCHPAGRAPAQAAVQCEPYLSTELERVTPRVVLALGQGAFESLTRVKEPLSSVRGRTWPVALTTSSAVVVPSFSPAYLLLNPSAKKAALEDLRLALNIAGKKPASGS